MARNASPKQIKFITDLFDALLPRKDEAEVQAAVAPLVATIQAARNGGPVDGYEAKRAIDAMLPFSPRQAAGPRSNKYAGKCGTCGTLVAEGAGRIERNAAGRWVTYHLADECGTAPVAPASDGLTPGVYVNAGGVIVKIQANRQGTGVYAKAWTGGGWEYQPALKHDASLRPITAEEAAVFGHQHDACVFCGTALSDDRAGRSVEVGYGPVCAKNNGLPWG